MEHEILDLIDKYWKFDNDQTPVSNWHDKQELLEAVRKALRIHDVVGRSEQLKAYTRWLRQNDHLNSAPYPPLVTQYLKSL